tara:strand:+ start:959 stop:1753 length:795 start_codon:yes stop_codon:yes gene_type:complete
MGSYLALLKGGYKVALQYRFDFVVGLFRIPLTLIIFYFLWKAVFAFNGTDVINGYTFETMVGYYVLSMVVGMFTWMDIDNWLRWDVKSGEVVSEFMRPLNFVFQYLFIQWGMSSLSVLISLVPTLVIGYLFVGLMFFGWVNFLFFIVSLVLAMAIVFLVTMFVGLLAFWLTDISGIIKVKNMFIAFLSGTLIPLSFFPEVVQKVFAFLPFQYMKYIPINIYLGIYTVNEILFHLGVMVLWVIGLYVLVHYQSKLALKKMSGVGI